MVDAEAVAVVAAGAEGGGSPSHPSRSGSPLRATITTPPEPAIYFFDNDITREGLVRSPDLHRVDPSQAYDARRPAANVGSNVSYALHGPVDRGLAASPSATGSTAPQRSPYLSPLPARKRAEPRPVEAEPSGRASGQPMPLRRALGALASGSVVVGGAGAGVRGACRQASGAPPRPPPGPDAPPPIAAKSSAGGDEDGGSGGRKAVGTKRSSGGAVWLGSIAAVYGPAPGQMQGHGHGGSDAASTLGTETLDGASSEGHNSGAGGGGEGGGVADGGEGGWGSGSESEGAGVGEGGAGGGGVRKWYLGRDSTYAPIPLHVPASGPAQHRSSAAWAEPPPDALAAPASRTPSFGSRSGAAHPGSSPPAPQQRASDTDGGGGGALPLLEHHHHHHPPPPRSTSSAASSVTAVASMLGAPYATARLAAQEGVLSLPQRSASWRRSLAADYGSTSAASGYGSALRRSATSTHPPIAGRHLEGFAPAPDGAAPQYRVHSVEPELRPQAHAAPGPGPLAAWPFASGGAGAATASGVGGGGGANVSGAGGRRSSSGGSRGSRPPREVVIDPDILRAYTERPPKLATPNNASRPVTSSDFKAFKNHTVTRTGAPNTLRTPLGSSAGAAGPGGVGATAEARGVTPLSSLLVPAWLQPAARPRSPHLGVGGVLGSATSVPGLFVPLGLDLPPRPTSRAPSPAQGPADVDGTERLGTPLAAASASALTSSPPPPAPPPAVHAAARAAPGRVRCGAGELALDVKAWLTPAAGPSGDVCGLFGGDDGTESVALLSRVVKGTVQLLSTSSTACVISTKPSSPTGVGARRPPMILGATKAITCGRRADWKRLRAPRCVSTMVLSHRGLNLVSGPRHMTVKPNYDALLIQGYTQVWRPRHLTTVTFELALSVPLRSFALLQDARQGVDAEVAAAIAAEARRRPLLSAEASASGGAPAAASPSAAGPQALPLTPSRALKFVGLPGFPQNTSLSGGLPSPRGGSGGLPSPGRGGGAFGVRRDNAGGGVGPNTGGAAPSQRHCAAVTFVPASHFSPAELEEALGEEVAPGPRAQAAALRAGLPAGPPPQPVDLVIVVDCCGPSGMAAHLMTMLQTLQVLLRSLPAADSGGGAGGGVAAGTAAAAAIAAAGMFNVVLCPAAPPPPDDDDDNDGAIDDNPFSRMLPPEQEAVAFVRQRTLPKAPAEAEAVEAEPPVWLFPDGPRPVTSDCVEAALAWVRGLLADPAALVAWAQPLPRIHHLLRELAAAPTPPGYRRAALLLCQRVGPREDKADGLSPLASASRLPSRRGTNSTLSRQVSRQASRQVSRRSRTSTAAIGRSLSFRPGLAGSSLNFGGGGGGSGGGAGGRGGTAASTILSLMGQITPVESAANSPRRALSWDPYPHTPPPHQQPQPQPQPQQLAARPGAAGKSDDELEADAGAEAGPFGSQSSPRQRPRSSFARDPHRSAAADGVRWSYVFSEDPAAPAAPAATEQNPAATPPAAAAAPLPRASHPSATGLALGDAEREALSASASPARSSLRALRLSTEGPAVAAAGAAGEALAAAVAAAAAAEPPDLGFTVFVVVHELEAPPNSALAAVGAAAAGGLFGATGPSYLLAYHLYQKHLEGLVYDQAREDVAQLPLGYFERLADMHGGFTQGIGFRLESRLQPGGSVPATPLERSRAEAREARVREALHLLREHALRGAVRGPVWSTVLALALLRSRYGAVRLSWISLEAKAFAWLERRWPPASQCPISPPAAIMRVSALLG
ncbi:hypothetical protein TSOC_001047 [Tetrabaena socialis]|uniref:Uncharacterized protein n=1 Tax=Tetrabaena socialis TaxID=47790 RepID=A0A2J8AHL6_9CHLO|nr:hypothetical protein TSOC_001047 [Tetrabaena socialis]|eukprot:PNH12015.1 hypothetical protein TSOC_001047 [Tetrabaena socialis]